MKKLLSRLALLASIAVLFFSCDNLFNTGSEDEATYTLSVSSDGNGSVSVSPAGSKFKEGTSVTLTATANSGYEFHAWKNSSGSIVSTANPYTFTINADTTLKASFVREQATLTVSVEGNGTLSLSEGDISNVSSISESFDVGTELTVTATPADGNQFVGWSGDYSGVDPAYTFKITKDTNLTARFALSTTNLYTITVNVLPEGAGTVTGAGRYEEGDSVSLVAEAESGYYFDKWTGDATGTEPSLTISSISSDMTIIANFGKYYTITASAQNADITLDPQKEFYRTGDSVTVSIEPHEGYQFTGWTGGTLSGKNRSVTIAVGTEDIIIGADIVERWLVLLHFAIDNNIDYSFEKENGIISNYLETLASVKAADTDDVMDILVLMDSYDTSDPIETGYTTTFTDGYYEISGGSFASDLKYSSGEINSGLPATSKAFMDWVYENYAGKRVMYSIFNHGSGFDDLNDAATYGIGFDDSNNDALSHKELAQVSAYLKTKAGGKKIDIMYPYACLMGGMELAWELRNNADYLIISEEVFPAEKWSYEALAEIAANPEISPLALAKAFCDSAYYFFSNPSMDRVFTLAVVDLSKLQALYNALNSLGSALDSIVGTNLENATALNDAAKAAVFMATPYYTDIAVFMDRLDVVLTGVSSYTSAVRSGLAAAVVYNRNYTSSLYDETFFEDRYNDACGLSIFHNIWEAQHAGYEYNPALYSSILTFGANNAWADYAQAMYELTPDPPEPLGPDKYEPDYPTTTNQLLQGNENKQLHTFHYIEGEPDVDVMYVELTAGTTYTFETQQGTIGTDTVMELYDSTGAFIIDNDDIDYPSNVYSKITYTPTVSGTYILHVVDYYLSYGDYYVYFDQGTWGPKPGPALNKWSPLKLNPGSFFD